VSKQRAISNFTLACLEQACYNGRIEPLILTTKGDVTMEQIIAACGLDCAQCPAYQATQANDEAAKERIAAQWRVEYNSPTISVQDVTCDGCMSGERHGGYCAQCPIRACAAERSLANCAACDDYGCDKVEGFFKMAPQARVTLEAIRAQRVS
jgi:hypothetical protein